MAKKKSKKNTAKDLLTNDEIYLTDEERDELLKLIKNKFVTSLILVGLSLLGLALTLVRNFTDFADENPYLSIIFSVLLFVGYLSMAIYIFLKLMPHEDFVKSILDKNRQSENPIPPTTDQPKDNL